MIVGTRTFEIRCWKAPWIYRVTVADETLLEEVALDAADTFGIEGDEVGLQRVDNEVPLKLDQPSDVLPDGTELEIITDGGGV